MGKAASEVPAVSAAKRNVQLREADVRRLFSQAIMLIFAMTSGALAQTTPLRPELSGIGFLVGTWSAGTGMVAETGGTSRGSSTITSEAGGAVLLRRDHTDLFNADGMPTGGFDQIMMIYPERGSVHADYSDGDHLIHYTSAVIEPGHSVSFTTTASTNAPLFRLSYEETDPATLTVRFEMAPAGQTGFHPIASGTLHKSRP